MRLPRVPGARDLVHVGERAAEAVELVLGLGPRMLAMLDEAGRVVDRVDALLDRLEESRATADNVLARAEEMLLRVEETRSSADGLLRRTQRAVAGIDETRASAQELITRTDAVVDAADGTIRSTDKVVGWAEVTVSDAGAMVARTRGLLDLVEPSLVRLQPVLERLAETTRPDEVDALATLLDRLPLVTTQFEREVLPIMRTLGTVAPDVADLLEVMSGLHEMLGSVPGLGRVKKRLDEEAESGS